jgi:hypothetical protein
MTAPDPSTESSEQRPYPVRVEGALDAQLSRWLWLVKWLLAIPHFVVLAFLWAAFVVLSIVALAAIVITGRYPRSLFEFNTGVLRWTWRVAFYSYAVLGTDRYPPFTLGRVPDYPASFEVEYPERLSRGLALVKWWLLAIPQYVILSFLVGATPRQGWPGAWAGGIGLIEILAVIAAIALLFTSRYPSGIFDLVMGLNRWVLRVAAYAGLMTDNYPPFRLQQGGAEPELAPAVTPAAPRWRGGRVAVMVVGTLLALVSFGMVVGGCAGIALDQTQRDSDGYLMTPSKGFGTQTYALVSTTADLHNVGSGVRRAVGAVRFTSTSNRALFVGLGPAADVNRYLAGTAHATVTRLGQWGTSYRTAAGGDPALAARRANVLGRVDNRRGRTTPRLANHPRPLAPRRDERGRLAWAGRDALHRGADVAPARHRNRRAHRRHRPGTSRGAHHPPSHPQDPGRGHVILGDTYQRARPPSA